ncbi:anti-CBASS protein Acb1 family protein [Halovenus marina]|uniref:anti-CBASS protein Acb1 family protein n=1 Tax=Halovenus marina TaxID=3396621 RepID=UPI003F55876A
MSSNTQNGESPKTAGEVALRANAVIDGLRYSLANELGDSGHDARDWYETFGWPNRGNNADWDADNYYALYLRNAYAYAVVAQKPKTTWKHAPEIRDRADQEEDAQRDPTDFERAITKLDREHDLWHYAHRVDRMAGVGRHGLLVIDYADTNSPEDFEDEFTGVENTTGLDMINGYRVYPEPMIEDIEWGKAGSDRWGKPVEYQIDLGDDADAGSQDEENTTLTIHHSRVVDVPARVLDDDETRARPRQEPVLNNILDIEKALGSTAELSYRAADYGLNVNLDPDKVDTSGDALDMMESDLQDWYHGLQPFLRTTGADVNRLGGEVKDPSGIVDNNVRALSTQTGIPQRVLEGASLGELASAEKDEEQYLGMIAERQRQYAEPYIARAIIDHHLEDEVLPDFEGDWYDIIWPDLAEMSEQEEAEVMSTRAEVITNLQTAVPALRGERAEEFVETGEFSEREDGETAGNVDEDDPRVQEVFDDIVGNDTRYEAGDWVDTPDGKGLIDDAVQDGTVDGMEASSDSPVYAVIMLDEATVDFYRASDIQATEGPETDIGDPGDELATANSSAGALAAWMDILGADITANDWSMPPSWRKSETPSRVILLDAWASMGAQFDCGGACCKGEMVSSGMSPGRANEFCAAMKDEVLGTEQWRGGWAE